MFKRLVLAVAGVVVMLFAVTVGAQRSPSDRISGVWASDGRPFLELSPQNDGVSGTVHFYEGTTRRASAPVDSGSFDEPTGALHLMGRVTRPDGSSVSYVIEGVLEDDVLRVTLVVDGANRGSQVLRRRDPQAK